ncbi:MAG: flagellar hook-length control protein FliK [Pseudomonadota bacterium]
MTDILSRLPVQKINVSKTNALQLRPAETQRSRDAEPTERRSDRMQDAKSNERIESRERANEKRINDKRADEQRADRAERADQQEKTAADRADRAKRKQAERDSRTDAAASASEGQDLNSTSSTEATEIASFEMLLDAEVSTGPVLENAVSDLPVVDAPPMQTPFPTDVTTKTLETHGQQLAASTSIAALAATGQVLGQGVNAELSANGTAVPAVLADDAMQISTTGAAPAQAGLAGALKQINGAASLDPAALSGGVDVTATDGDTVFIQRPQLDGANTAGRAAPAWAGSENATMTNNTNAQPNTAPALGTVANVATAAVAAQAQAQAALDAVDAPADGDSTSPTTNQATAESRSNAAAMMAKDPVMAHRAMHMAAVKIASAVHAGGTRFEIQLDPPELGRIEVRMVIDKGNAQARLSVERPETLDMLMRDKLQLERILASLGLDLEGGVDMQLMDQGDGEQSGFEELFDEGSDYGSQFLDDTVGAGPIEDRLEGLHPNVVAAILEAAGNPLSLNRMA